MALRRLALGVLRTARRSTGSVESAAPRLDADLRAPIERAASGILEHLGSFDGDFRNTFDVHREATFDAHFRQGQRDAARSGTRSAFIAGSGNTQSTAVQRARTTARLTRSPWLAVAGGSWMDNLHQMLGSGVGGTQQQRVTSYALGRAGSGDRVVAHSQGNLSVESAMQSLERQHPAVRQRAVIGIGSPLPFAAGPRSSRVTGRLDPIRLTRLGAGVFFGGVRSGAQHTVPGGHGAEGYLRNIPRFLLQPQPKPQPKTRPKKK